VWKSAARYTVVVVVVSTITHSGVGVDSVLLVEMQGDLEDHHGEVREKTSS
jgi:hypothetical protein